MDQLSPRLLEVTSPVYTIGSDGLPESWGSAVFVTIGHIRFAFSAAHVFDRRHSSPLYVHARDGLVAIGGTFTRVSRAGSTPTTDPIDLSVVRLSDPIARAIPDSAFAGWQELDHTGPIPSRDHYLVLGFPVSKQRDALHGNELRAAAFRFGAKESPALAYKSLRHDPRSSLIIGFDHKRMWDAQSRVTAPNLNGMSGCGVWRAGHHIMRMSHKPRLAAILVEWHRRASPKHILATRIRRILAAIASEHQDAARVMQLLP